jgi:hypothetical protein
MVKVAVTSHAVQKDGGDPALSYVLEHGRVVPARNNDQCVNFAPNQRADPLPLPGFLLTHVLSLVCA